MYGIELRFVCKKKEKKITRIKKIRLDNFCIVDY